MTVLRIIAYNILFFLLIFAALEIVTRVLAPAYVNAYFTKDITHGNPIYRNATWGNRVDRDGIDTNYSRNSDEFRILFIGDSVTFGYGIPHNSTYHQQVGNDLAGRECRTRVEGVGQYYSNLEQLMNSKFRDLIVNTYDPDLVIYQFNVNDLDPPGPPKKPENETLTVREKFEKLRLSYLNRSAFLKAMQSFGMRQLLRSRSTKLSDSLRYSPALNPGLYAKQWEEFDLSLEKTRRLYADQGAEFAVLLIPEAIRISDSELDNEFRIDTSGIEQWPGDRVRAIAEKEKIWILDATPFLKAYRQSQPHERMYFPNDANHPNALGHRIIATAVSELLANRVPGCNRHAMSEAS